MSAILSVDRVSRRFGGLTAVDDLSFEVEPGCITSLIGGNGAGKTTAFNLITGYLKPDSGSILFHGQRIDGMAPHLIAKAGIARGFQELRLFNRLTALDNVQAAIPGQRGERLLRALFGGPQIRREAKSTTEHASNVLEGLTLLPRAQTLAEMLSYGQQKLLALGRLTSSGGDFLMLDEPTSGLSPSMVDDFCDRMRKLVSQGRTLLLIEHNVEIVMKLSDRVIVLHQGRRIAQGTPDQVKRDEAVMQTYLGLGA